MHTLIQQPVRTRRETFETPFEADGQDTIIIRLKTVIEFLPDNHFSYKLIDRRTYRTGVL